MRKRGELAQARRQIDGALVKAMANALRNQILAILGERKGSAIGLSEELGADYWQVNYEIEVLRKAKLIKKVGERKRRGATEVFYEATARAYLDPSVWPKVADPIKPGLRASLFQNLLVDAATAIYEETYDSHENAHMSWSPLIVDEKGWQELMAVLYRALEEVLAIHETSGERLITADEEGISCTVSILGYPSAVKKRKVGLPSDAEELVDLFSPQADDDPQSDGNPGQKGKKKGTKRRERQSRQAKRKSDD